ncbi:MAG TPA: PQQ-binding-like beta-propeller repeat protein [Planctomycetota bacterium]|nr:PQQ-binding-like beta-propeller repeat protein [Planctomycetota bacterium]
MSGVRRGGVVWMLVAVMLTSAAWGAATDWPWWRGAEHDGKSPDTGLLKEWPEGGPKLLWQVDSIGKGFSNVAVTGGTIYTTGDLDGKLMLFAFDLEGKLKWKAEHDASWTASRPGSRSTPTIDGDRLYILSGHGLVGCYDAKTGAKKWAKSSKDFGGRSGGWGYAESVLIQGDWAIFKPGGQNCIVALDKMTGDKVWTSKGFAAGPEYSSCLPFVYEGVPLLVTGTRSGIVCVDAKTGEKLWSNPWSANNTANCPTPAFADGYVFWANGYGKGGICMKLKKVDGKVTAEEAWTTKDMVCHHGGYVIEKGCIYGNNGGGWACLDLKTGEKKWEARGVGKGSLCWADGMLYLFGESGGQAALATCSPQGMELKGRVQVKGSGPSWAHPVVVGGRLYLRYDTNLYCFDVKAK